MNVALAALRSSDEVLRQLDHPAEPSATRPHSVIDYIPVAVAAVSSLASIVTSVALAVLGNTPLCIVQAVAGVASAITTYYLWSLIDMKDLETLADAFASRVRTLSTVALRLKDLNRGLTESQQALSDELRAHQQMLEQKKREATEALGKLQSVTEDLAKTRDDVRQVGQLFDSSHDMLHSMTSQMSQFLAAHKEMAESTTQLDQRLTALREIGRDFDKSLGAIDRENEVVAARRQRAREIALAVQAQFLQLGELLVALKEQSKKLESGLGTLTTMDHSLGERADRLEDVVERLDRETAGAQSLVDSLKPYVAIVPALKQRLGKNGGKS